jgi:hypothetical protein
MSKDITIQIGERKGVVFLILGEAPNEIFFVKDMSHNYVRVSESHFRNISKRTKFDEFKF